MSHNIRVFVMHDKPIICMSIRLLLASANEFDFMGEVSSVCQLTSHFTSHRQETQPHILLFGNGGTTIYDTANRLHQLCPSTRLIALLSSTDAISTTDIFETNLAGSLCQEELSECIIHVLHLVAQQHNHFSRAVIKKLTASSCQLSQKQLHTLTPQERKILDLLGHGQTNGEMSSQLGLAEQTIRNYVSSIYDKLDIRSRAELVAQYRTFAPVLDVE
ncbi:MAG: response regulator transcription factor [Chloroflexota bacterium]